MLSILSKKGFRIWSILLIIVIVFSIFACTVQEANAIAIPAVALTVIGTTMIAMGVYGYTTGQSMQDVATQIYNGLSAQSKLSLSKFVAISGASYILGESLYNDIKNNLYNVIDANDLSTAMQSNTVTQINKVIGGGMIVRPHEKIKEGVTGVWNGYNTQWDKNINNLMGIPIAGTRDSIHIELPNGTKGWGYVNLFPTVQFAYNSSNAEGYINSVHLIYTHSTSVNHYYTLSAKYANGSTVVKYQTVPISNDIISGSQAVTMGQTYDGTYFPTGWQTRAIDDGIITNGEIADNIGDNSISHDRAIPVLPVDSIDDLIPYTPTDIINFPVSEVVTDIGTGTIVGEGEITGEGTGTGIFEGIGRWVINIPILGSILQLLINILQAIQDLTAVSDFTLDFSPLKIGLTEVFPFCIPFDLLRMVTVYSAIPDDFVLSIDLETDYFVIDHQVDLSPFSIPIIFFRWIVTIWFSWILISRTRDMIKW